MTKDNVIPMKPFERFNVYRAEVTDAGDHVKSEQLGFAFMKPDSRMFRLKLWMFPKEQYFIAPQENDPSKYSVLALDEYHTKGDVTRTYWNKIGSGELHESLIRLRLHLLELHILVDLVPEKVESKALHEAA